MSHGHDLNGLTGGFCLPPRDQCSVDQRQGVSSAIRLLGQLLTSLVSTSVRYASGLTLCSLQLSISEASIAPRPPRGSPLRGRPDEVDACSGALEMLNPNMNSWGAYELARQRHEE